MSDFRVKFWGVRGSYPVPGESTVRVGGNTSCVEVEIQDKTIILDAGTGIIKLGNEILRRSFADKRPIAATILFTHMHHDHNQGFPFFKPAYIGSSTLFLFGPKLFQEDIGKVLSKAMLPPFFPVELMELNSARIIHNIMDAEVIHFRAGAGHRPEILNRFRETRNFGRDDVRIDIMKGYAHPKGGVIFYKIGFQGKSLVYATDTEGYIGGDRKLIDFAQDCDVLIHDCQYTLDEYYGKAGPSRQGFGHSTFEMAADVAKNANVKRLILFHHDPEHTDDQVETIETECRQHFPATDAAREGDEFHLIP